MWVEALLEDGPSIAVDLIVQELALDDAVGLVDTATNPSQVFATVDSFEFEESVENSPVALKLVILEQLEFLSYLDEYVSFLKNGFDV